MSEEFVDRRQLEDQLIQYRRQLHEFDPERLRGEVVQKIRQYSQAIRQHDTARNAERAAMEVVHSTRCYVDAAREEWMRRVEDEARQGDE